MTLRQKILGLEKIKKANLSTTQLNMLVHVADEAVARLCGVGLTNKYCWRRRHRIPNLLLASVLRDVMDVLGRCNLSPTWWMSPNRQGKNTTSLVIEIMKLVVDAVIVAHGLQIKAPRNGYWQRVYKTAKSMRRL